tara:strand:+ start:26024 stop:26188 length:165 start_codon:yes stop_codon:yes gene_type:complete
MEGLRLRLKSMENDMPPRHALPALTDDLTWTLIIAATLALGLPLLIAASHFVMN